MHCNGISKAFLQCLVCWAALAHLVAGPFAWSILVPEHACTPVHRLCWHQGKPWLQTVGPHLAANPGVPAPCQVLQDYGLA